jgi:hypothetical protein
LATACNVSLEVSAYDDAMDSSGSALPRSDLTAPTFTKSRNRGTQRIYGSRDIIISFDISKKSTPMTTQLVPPLSWLRLSGSKVKVLHTQKKVVPSDSSKSLKGCTALQSYLEWRSTLELSVERQLVDNSLEALRSHGFQREDIYRMMDKGPWILSLNIVKSLIKLSNDIKVYIDFLIASCLVLTIYLLIGCLGMQAS